MKSNITGTAATPEIIFEDSQVLVAIKRPGILAQADGSQSADMLSLLKQDLKDRYNKPGNVFLGLVHRLDQPVGGLMVFARTSKAAGRLSAQVRDHQLAKYYLAVVTGIPQQNQGVLTDNLLQDPSDRQVRVVPAGQGQEARLEYRLMQSRRDLGLSLLAICLGTGRGHQIRVQLSHHGWPIAGDRRYGSDLPAQPHYRTSRTDPALFACRLGFFHPVSREWLEFSALPPEQAPWNAFDRPDLDALPAYFGRQNDWQTI